MGSVLASPETLEMIPGTNLPFLSQSAPIHKSEPSPELVRYLPRPNANTIPQMGFDDVLHFP